MPYLSNFEVHWPKWYLLFNFPLEFTIAVVVGASGTMVYYPLAEKKYWKIPRGVMVIPRKNIGFSSEEPKAPRKKIQYFSEGLPSTPSGIFQYFFSDKG